MAIREKTIKLGFLAAAFALMVWGFQLLLFTHLAWTFNEATEDMTFGWFVPIFSLYVVWVDRKNIAATFARPSLVGTLLMLPFLFLAFLGVRGSQVRFEMLAFIGLLVAIPWAIFGRRTAARVLFPAGFLLFCIPLSTYLDVVTVHLRLFATGLASSILQGVGASIIRTGTMLASPDGSFSIDVAAPCSGLRSIFALMALTAGYAYFNQPTWLRRAALFACSVPLAILGNVMRILTICLVGTYASSDFATGFYHDYSGYVVFIVAIALMVVCGEAITRMAKKCAGNGDEGVAVTGRDAGNGDEGVAVTGRDAGNGDEGVAVTGRDDRLGAAPAPIPARRFGDGGVAVTGGYWIPVVTILLLGAAMFELTRTQEPVVCEAPAVALAEIPGFTSERVEVSEAELTVLPGDTQFDKRIYRDGGGKWFSVSAVIGGTSKASIHRPELCLPAQGFLMMSPHTREVDGRSWRFISLEGGANRPSEGFAYTFFNQAGFRTSSHASRIWRDILDRSFKNRIDRWVMITVNSSTPDEDRLVDFISRLERSLK